MKRILLAAAAALMLVGGVLVAQPEGEADALGYPPVLWFWDQGWPPNEGWWQARYSNSPLCVADIPFYNDYAVLSPFNTVAGWSLLYPWDQCWNWGSAAGGLPSPSITFSCQTTSNPPGLAWTVPSLFSNQTFWHATIRWPCGQTPTITTMQHEVGHALGFGHANPTGCQDYMGFMSLCNSNTAPWQGLWWGEDDYWIMWNAGYTP